MTFHIVIPIFILFNLVPNTSSFLPPSIRTTTLKKQHSSSTTSPTTSSSNLKEAPVNFAGTGPRQVDMNQYNLPYERIVTEWTAIMVEKSRERDAGVYLGAKNDREIFVDVVKLSFPRGDDNGGGLGIQLLEIAGGRNDGIGITIVSGLVPGGTTDGLDILPGDVISRVSIVRSRRRRKKDDEGNDDDDGGMLSEIIDEISVRTECLDYDATIDAIRSLPSPQNKVTTSSSSFSDENYVLIIKRLRRKPKIKINLQYPPSQKENDTSIDLYAGENLRLGMLVRGIKLNDAYAKRFDTKTGGNCGAGGLCRTCAVSVVRGGELFNPQKVAEKQMLEDNPRWRLACKAFVGYGMKEGEDTLKVNPRQWD